MTVLACVYMCPSRPALRLGLQAIAGPAVWQSSSGPAHVLPWTLCFGNLVVEPLRPSFWRLTSCKTSAG